MLFGYSFNKGIFKSIISPLQKIADYFDKSIYDILNLALPIIIGILTNFISGEYSLLIILLIINLLFITIWSVRQIHFDKKNLLNDNKSFSEKISELESTKRELIEQIEAIKGDFRLLNNQLIESHLMVMSSRIGLNHDHRISIYFEFEGVFFILGRFSDNPKYKNIHTTKFPIDEGVLSKSWENGYYEDFKCPQYTPIKGNKKNPYHEYHMTHYGFSKKKVESLNMKSCNHIGLHIKDNDNPVGVILFESTKCDLEFIKSSINNICEDYKGTLAKLVNLGKKYTHIVKFDINLASESPESEILKKAGNKNV